LKTYLNTDETAKLEDAAMCIRDKLLIRILARLGCRVSEALALEVEDIDLTQGMVSIEHLKKRIKLHCPKCDVGLGKSHIYCPRCGMRVKEVIAREQEHRRVRMLPLDRDTLEMLRDYINRNGPVNRKSKMLIFGINRHRAWQIVKDCADRAGLPKLVNPESGRVHGVSPHRLRDAFAVHAIRIDDSGDGLRLLQEHLGHASFNTTAKYRKVAGDELKEWYNKLWTEEGK